jgi:diguanylate cyclase
MRSVDGNCNLAADPESVAQMKSLELLSETIIEILKEFSSNQLALTPNSLSHALSERKALSCLPPQIAFIDPYSVRESLAPSPQTPFALGPLHDGDSDASIANLLYFPQVRNTYVQVLAGLAPISREEYVERSSELQQRLEECNLMEVLVGLGDDLVSVVRLLVNRALEDMDHASDFLAELGKDLSGMEAQLFSYKSHNRETYLANDKFTSHLLSDTEEMSQAFDLSHVLEDTRGFIVSKLMTIKEAIRIKRREDEIRLQDADRKIDELQESLRGYKEEVLRTKERADVLEKEALLDGLTEIHNRRAYELRIREELRRYHRDGQGFSLVLIDVDGFKQINDLYGHPAGDKCLRGIAGRIRSAVRTTDFLARYGGEEFVVILAGSSGENARRIAEKIRVLIEKTKFCYRDEEIPVTISLGVTESKPGDGDQEALFVRVDDAMYRAKKEGRNRVCVI